MDRRDKSGGLCLKEEKRIKKKKIKEERRKKERLKKMKKVK